MRAAVTVAEELSSDFDPVSVDEEDDLAVDATVVPHRSVRALVFEAHDHVSSILSELRGSQLASEDQGREARTAKMRQWRVEIGRASCRERVS